MSSTTVFKGMRFCKECDNMLQPKEEIIDQGVGRLVYYCRICGYFEKAKPLDQTDNCVYKSEQTNISENYVVDKECIKDPTLSRRKNLDCGKCHHTEAVTFTNPTKDRMNLIFVCTRCTHYWRKDELDEHDVLSGSDPDK